MKERVGTIDCTPTWEGILPLLIMAIQRGSIEAQQELTKMAKLADLYNEINKD